MKVICAGMSKTGTTTMNQALTELGYIVYDFQENYMFHHDKWTRIAEEGWTTDDFREMYEEVDATCDSPAYCFWEEILEAFPDAKVVLTTRDSEDQWYVSMKGQLDGFASMLSGRFHGAVSPTYRKFLAYSYTLGMLPFGLRNYRPVIDTLTPAPEMPFKQAYRRHNAHVLQNCPKEKLLVYNCKEGWEPLCRFLGKEIPSKPFPHANAGAQLAVDIWQVETFRRIAKEAFWAKIGLTAIGVLTIYGLVKRFYPVARV